MEKILFGVVWVGLMDVNLFRIVIVVIYFGFIWLCLYVFFNCIFFFEVVGVIGVWVIFVLSIFLYKIMLNIDCKDIVKLFVEWLK